MATKSSSTTTPARRKSAGVSALQKESPVAALADAVKKISKLTQPLNSSVDGATKLFRATEEVLGKLGVGIDGAVEIYTTTTTEQRENPLYGRDDEPENTPYYVARELQLIYLRIGGKYRIGFQERVYEYVGTNSHGTLVRNEVENCIPWDQAPREWKLDGANELTTLVETMAEKIQRLIDNVTPAIAAVDTLLKDLLAIQTPQADQ